MKCGLRMCQTLSLLRPPMPWHRATKCEGGEELVIFLHGLWRSHWAMEPLVEAAVAAGFSTLNVPYPSFKESLEEMVERVRRIVEEEQAGYSKIHFVTHSLGGVIVRRYLRQGAHAKCGRVVMVAPPLRGSRIIDWLADSPLRWVLGPAGEFLSTASMKLEGGVEAATVEVAVLMGDKVRIPLLHHVIGEKSDGIVRVAAGRASGIREFRVVHADHTLITSHPEVLAGACHFLKHGRLQEGA